MNPKRAPKLFIGPWIGEFGVELLRWQSIARTLAQSRQWSEITVATHPDRFFLYNDFATKFVPHIPNTIHTVGHQCRGHVAQPIHTKYINVEEGDLWLDPNARPLTGNVSERLYYPIGACVPTYRDFSIDAAKPDKIYDILLHARATPKAGQNYKNWPSARFNALVDALPKHLRIASVGAVNGAHKIKGTDDLRGIPLTKLAGLCRTAKLMIGPSSGSIHFAMHCGLPVVTWIEQGDKYNYYPVWNPLSVPFCCLSGWQPEPGLVFNRVSEMLRLIEGQRHPIDLLVVGTKRSGHHGFIEWVSRFQPTKRFILWNDCVKEGMMSFPDEPYSVPTANCYPKQIHSNERQPNIYEWNSSGRTAVRCLSFEGIPLFSLAELPEAKQARKVVIILRDLANTAASLKAGIPNLADKHFLHPDFRRIMDRAREYLKEATGVTHQLADIASKVVFVSYNLWHTDASYRREIAAALGFGRRDADRGLVSAYVHTSSFQKSGIAAEQLDTLARWKRFAGNLMFWNLVCSPSTHQLEKKFHGKATPDYFEWPK